MRKPDGTKNRNHDRNTPINHGPTDSGGQTQRRHALPQDNSGPNKQPLYTMDDKEFTKEEVKQVIESLQPKKAPGPNGITNEIIKLILKRYQKQ